MACKRHNAILDVFQSLYGPIESLKETTMACSDEKARDNAMHSIIAGFNCHIDIRGWARLTCEQSHRAYRSCVCQRETLEGIADSRLEEVDRLTEDLKGLKAIQSLWVSQTAHDAVKLDNMKLKAELSKFTGPGSVIMPKSLYDHSVADLNKVINEKDSRIKELEEVTDAPDRKSINYFGASPESVNGRRIAALILKFDALNEVISKKNERILELGEVTDALNDKREELESRLSGAQTLADSEIIAGLTLKCKAYRDALKSLKADTTDALARSNKRSAEITKLEDKLAYANETTKDLGVHITRVDGYNTSLRKENARIGVLDGKLQGSRCVVHKRDSRINELEELLLGSRNSFQDLHTKFVDRDRELAALQDSYAKLKNRNFASLYGNTESRLTAEKEAHVHTTKVYESMVTKLGEAHLELATLKCSYTKLKSIIANNKCEISELDGRVEQTKDELKAWQNEHCYIAYFDIHCRKPEGYLTVQRVTIDGEEVTAKGNCFYNSHNVKVGSYFNCGDRYLVFCDGSLSAPVCTRIR
jgi:chromosome segregation ATPase